MHVNRVRENGRSQNVDYSRHDSQLCRIVIRIINYANYHLHVCPLGYSRSATGWYRPALSLSTDHVALYQQADNMTTLTARILTYQHCLPGAAKKWILKVFRCFLSNRLEF